MSNVIGLRCVHCARTYSAEDVEYFCPVCGYADGILDVVYDYEAVKRELYTSALAENGDYSIWRYLPLLPVNDRQLFLIYRWAGRHFMMLRGWQANWAWRGAG
jgi:threonine synthase